MTKTEAEDYVYKSYLKAEKYHNFYAGDREKRKPELSKEIIERKNKTPCVVITGSKGKGSIACMISQILQSSLKVGMMTSPHVIDFCERFQINGEKISDDDFAKQMEQIRKEFEPIEQAISKDIYISPIGIQTALALQYFNANQTEFNIFECGKGARYDDVCNVKHDYSVIGSVFLEHTRELGETLEEIARDKAYVISGAEKCVYIAPQKESVQNIFKEKAQQLQVPIKCYGKEFEAININYTKTGMLFDVRIDDVVYPQIHIPVLGEHQAQNYALAFAICKDILKILDIDIIREKINLLQRPGRMEILSQEPYIILDACINGESCGNIKKLLQHLRIEQYNMIVGIPDDKDYVGVIEALRQNAERIILTKSLNTHYIFTEKQKENLERKQIHTCWTNSIRKALDLVQGEGKPLLILGTTSLVAEVKKLQAEGVFTYEV